MTLQEQYEKQKEINKELVDENEALKFAARMSEKTEKQLRKENAELKKRLVSARAEFQRQYKENEELKHNKKTVAHLADCLEEKMKERIEELEQENAELKAEIENDRDLPTVAYMQGAEKQKKKDEKQLTKAKALLAKWVELYNPKSKTVLPTPIQIDTEQFLKEIEK